ncbi:MAG TPA: EamA family transporter [Acidimicrobiales bacterium]|nr:EamA family transporter [Acidimicrobiales bacterium]
MPVVLALLSSLLWGTADFVGGTLSRRLEPLRVVLSSQAVALVALVPLAGWLRPDLEARVLLAGVAAGAIGPLALGAFYRALGIGTMGVVAPIAGLGVVVPVAAGILAGERPTAAQLAGIAVAVLGVVLASGPEMRGEGRGGTRALLLAAGAAVGFGLVFVLLAEGSEGGGAAEVIVVLTVMRATSVLGLGGALVARAGTGAVRVPRPDLPALAVVGAFDVGANGAFALASQSDLVSVTAVLASLYPAVTAVLAWRIDGERLQRVQLSGVVLALAGVVLLSAG